MGWSCHARDKAMAMARQLGLCAGCVRASPAPRPPLPSHPPTHPITPSPRPSPPLAPQATAGGLGYADWRAVAAESFPASSANEYRHLRLADFSDAVNALPR